MIAMNKIYKDKKVINIIDEVNDLNYCLEDNQMLIINCFFNNVNDMQIVVKQTNNSYLVINYAGYIFNDAKVNIFVEVVGNDNKTVINVRNISEENHATFDVNVHTGENTKNNEITEDLKAINEEGTITYMPILQVDTNEVSAEHYATIGNLDEKELFYLESKGISTNKAKELLKISFMYNLFSDAFIRMLDNRKDESE